MKSFFDEFKTFAMRGNVVDLAIAVVIGAAFGKIVDSLVKDIIMPPLGFFAFGDAIKNMAWVLREETAEQAAVVLSYGNFINTVIEFLLIALAIFIVMKQINRLVHLHKKEEEKKPAEPSDDVKLLTEIRDLLKQKA